MMQALKVRQDDATRRELAFAQLELDGVMEQIQVMKDNREEPTTLLKRKKSVLEAEISLLFSDLGEG